MNRDEKIEGYRLTDYHKGKVLEENDITGLKKIEITKSLLKDIKAFNNIVFGMEVKETKKDIRDFETKDGKTTFKAGGGYDITDCDLLGGSGLGSTKKLFNIFLELTKDKKNINSGVEEFKKNIDTYLKMEDKNTSKAKYLEKNKEKIVKKVKELTKDKEKEK